MKESGYGTIIAAFSASLVLFGTCTVTEFSFASLMRFVQTTHT